MSGGSYNYLFAQVGDVRGLGRQWFDLRAMRDRLLELYPLDHATRDTFELVAAIENAVERSVALADVWRAVEWCDSCDSTIEKVDQAIAAYHDSRGITARSPSTGI